MKMRVKFVGLSWGNRSPEEVNINTIQTQDGSFWTVCPGYEIEVESASHVGSTKEQNLVASIGAKPSKVTIEF